MSRLAAGAPTTPRTDIERDVLAYVRRERLFVPGATVLVAVSGGPDSVSLLAVLSSLAPCLRIALEAVHFNFGLRGRESDEDERFVAELCARLGIGLTTERVTLADSGTGGRRRSLQERARDARYERLTALANRLGATRVALGHTADDQAETLCMWMVRGTGLTGLRGIPPRRERLFVRPLLAIDRASILTYLAARGLAYRMDSTNATDLYLRNRIRRHVLPVLKRENPSLLKTWQRQADLLREDDRYLEELAASEFRRLRLQAGPGRLTLCRSGFIGLPLALQRRVIRQAVREARSDARGPSFQVVESIIRLARDARSERRVTCRGLRVTAAGDEVRFNAGAEPEATDRSHRLARHASRTMLPVSVPSTVRWESGPKSCLVHLECHSASLPTAPAKKGAAAVALDADRFSSDLVLRSWQPGDRFCPSGMGGHRQKLQDFFTNLRIPRTVRPHIPLLVAPEGILWVAGYRADERYVARPSTRRILRAYLSEA